MKVYFFTALFLILTIAELTPQGWYLHFMTQYIKEDNG